MQIYFAPMEGITGAIFRRLHHQYFPGVDRYFTPFISPTGDHRFTGRNLRELAPEDLKTLEVVPQLLTHNAEDFLWAAENLAELGFREVNLNLGCPSGTVVAKKKGAGLLAYPELLDELLEQIFVKTPLPVSVKTRLGMADPAEFHRLLAIYNRYPICQLILHPRTRAELYRGEVHMDCFDRSFTESCAPLCYNGNLVTAAQCSDFCRSHPNVEAVMIGRGLLANPALAAQLQGGSLERNTLLQFHNALCLAYGEASGGYQTVLPRMKELWFYLLHSFQADPKQVKQLRKAARWPEFYRLTQQILQEAPLRQDALPFS